jgi:hypothetical protein
VAADSPGADVSTPFYLLVGALLAVNWGGYLYFAHSKDLVRKRHLFPFYIHITMLLFLLLPASIGGPWWVTAVLVVPVTLIDRMWVAQTRFCDACAAYIPARGLLPPAAACPNCGVRLSQAE